MGIFRHHIVFDTETTGLNPHAGHEITSLSAMAINCATLDIHHAGKFNVFLKPAFPEKADKGALKVAGPAFEKAMKEGVDPKVGLQQFFDWCRTVNDTKNAYGKPFLWGHNIGFDTKFVKYWANYYKVAGPSPEKDADYPWFMEFDNAQMMLALFDVDPNVNDLKLNTALAQADLSRKGESHDSMEDVELTSAFLVRCIKFCRLMQKRMRVEKDCNEDVAVTA